MSSSTNDKMNMTFRIGIHLMLSQNGRVGTIFKCALLDILDGYDKHNLRTANKQNVVQVDIVQNIDESEIIICVLDDVSNKDQVSNPDFKKWWLI